MPSMLIYQARATALVHYFFFYGIIFRRAARQLDRDLRTAATRGKRIKRGRGNAITGPQTCTTGRRTETFRNFVSDNAQILRADTGLDAG